jgi:hypothetical protein
MSSYFVTFEGILNSYTFISPGFLLDTMLKYALDDSRVVAIRIIGESHELVFVYDKRTLQ